LLHYGGVRMSGYLFQGELDNTIHEIDYDDIIRLREENERDKAECIRITQGRYSGERPQLNNRTDIYRELLFADAKTDGFVMKYPHGTVIRQAERNHYYRGENQVFEKSMPSLLRKLSKINSEKETEIYRFVSDMRIAQFGNFLLKFEHVQNWLQNYGDVLFDVLAQHYGIETAWLDITNDFNVALFFATCYYDVCEKRWKPLTKDQIEKEESTRYGMIFHVPAWRAQAMNMNNFSDDTPFGLQDENSILPVGFQPFMRCHMQYGYGIYMHKELPLQYDINFEKLMFRHSEKLSKEVYDMMGQGSLIYPHEGLSMFDDIIDNIKNTSHFTEDDFEYAFENSHFFANREECKSILTQTTVLHLPIVISENPSYEWPKEYEKLLITTYKDFSIEDAYGIKLGSRSVFLP